jgi:hypothetical protein
MRRISPMQLDEQRRPLLGKNTTRAKQNPVLNPSQSILTV